MHSTALHRALIAAALLVLAAVAITGADAFPFLAQQGGGQGQAPRKLNLVPIAERQRIPDPLGPHARAAQSARIDALRLGQAAARRTDARAPPALVRVPDDKHPFQAPGTTDKRGPCPGLNTLANHGYLPRSGLVHANDIVEGTTQAFNLGVDLATFLAIFGILVDGDPLTGMLSIGGPTKSILGGGKAGLNNHGHFEGDASLTRQDFYLTGANYQFDAGLFAQFTSFNEQYGNGSATVKSLAEYRYRRFLDSKATNPYFSFTFPRYLFSYAEASLVLNAFPSADKGTTGTATDAGDLRSFFVEQRFPAPAGGWYRKPTPFGLLDIVVGASEVLGARFVPPGQNSGRDNYVPLGLNISAATLTPRNLGCALYAFVVESLAPSLVQGLVDSVRGVVSGLLGQLESSLESTFACAPISA